MYKVVKTPIKKNKVVKTKEQIFTRGKEKRDVWFYLISGYGWVESLCAEKVPNERAIKRIVFASILSVGLWHKSD